MRQYSRTRSRYEKKSSAHGSVPGSAPSVAAHNRAASAPRAGSRLSISTRSSPTALTSAPRSSGSTSKTYCRSGISRSRVRRSALGESLLKIRRCLARFEPVEKCVGCFEPYFEPLHDFFLLGALFRFHFVISRDHFSAAPAHARHFQHALHRGALPIFLKFRV